MENIGISVIIPQRNSLTTLPRLLDSIPQKDNIEIIIVDNSPMPITKENIGIDREYVLLWSPPERCAGGARNVGIENARGKWLIFCDADDYFTPNAFDCFFDHFDDDSDVIFFRNKSVFTDGSGVATRGDNYNRLIDDYLADKQKEINLRVKYGVPWAKMIRREFVILNHFRYDEVVAANDAYFSLLVGFYASKISAYREVVYIVTANNEGLTKRKDVSAIWSRYLVALRKNKFLKENNLSKYQSSVMFYIYESRQFGFKYVIKFIKEGIKYKQNFFIGSTRWFSTWK